MTLRLFLIALLAALVSACGTLPEAEPDRPVDAEPEEETDRGPAEAPDLSHLEEPEPSDQPLSRYGNPATYEVFGERYEVMSSEDARGFSEEGVASWYGKKFHGRRTSSGEPYDMYTLTAAHTQLPLPTYVRVTNQENNKSVIVRVNDRGPFADNRIIDLSYAAADRIDMLDAGTAPVRIETLSNTYDPETGPDEPVSADANGADESGSGEPASSGVVSASGRAVPDRHQPEDDNGTRATGDEPASADADTGGYRLQVGAFSERANAEAMKRRLEDEGITQTHITEENGIHRVHVGPAETRDEANSLEARLRGVGISESRVIEN